jgi:mannose-6-phosphate isomerase-like protein (cupin superfamily)
MSEPLIIKNEDQEYFYHKNDPNRIVKLILHPEFGGSRGVAVGVTVCQSGCKGSIHVHQNSDEIMIVLHGVGKFIVNNKEYTLREGEAIVVPKGTPHGYESLDPATPFEFIWIYNDPSDARFPENLWILARPHKLRSK